MNLKLLTIKRLLELPLLRINLKLEKLMYLEKNILLNQFIIEKLLIIMKLLNSTELNREKRLDLLLPENLNTRLPQDIKPLKDLLLNITLLDIFNLQFKEKLLELIFKEKRKNVLLEMQLYSLLNKKTPLELNMLKYLLQYTLLNLYTKTTIIKLKLITFKLLK